MDSGPCQREGTSCVGASLVTCTLDGRGCLMARTETCTAPEVCTTSTTGATCEMPPVDCSQIATCNAPGVSCDGAVLNSCRPDADGCLIQTTSDCAAMGQICTQTTTTARCEREQDPCEGVADRCTTPGMSCSGTRLLSCAPNAMGCLVSTTVRDCGAVPGGACRPGPPASCVGDLLGDWGIAPVVRSGDPNPSALGAFTAFGHAPSIEGATTYFRGSAMTLQTPPQDTLTDAVYRHDGQQLHVMMRAGEAVPGGSGILENFDAAGSSGVRVHLGRAVVMANGDRFQRGMYAMSASTTTERVVARSDGIPGGFDRFIGLEDPQVFEAVEAFSGDDRGTQSGAYFRRNGLLFKLVDLFTTMPNASGRFTDLRVADLDATRALVVGSGPAPASALFSGPQRGVYSARFDAQQVDAIIDRGAFVPGSTVAFASFEGPHIDGEGVVFVGRQTPFSTPHGEGSKKGIYRIQRGLVTTLVDTDTTMPGSTFTFSADHPDGLSGAALSSDGGRALFRGVGVTSSSGLHVGLYHHDGTNLTKIIDVGDRLDGKAVDDLRVGRQSIHGRDVVFLAVFADGTRGIFRASKIR